MQNVIAASGVCDGGDVCERLMKVEKLGNDREAFANVGKYHTFDRKIAAALGKFFKGERACKVNDLERSLLSKEQRLRTCGERLCIMYQYFRTNKNSGCIHSIFDVGQVIWLGSTHIETFRNI